MTAGRLFSLILIFSFACSAAGSQRDQVNYLLHCRGCHGPEGLGAPGSVPRLAGFMGKFLAVEGGREFLVRVPGAATAAVDDQALADLLNWMLHRFSPGEVPDDFQPYTADEVATLRARPLVEVAQVREQLLARMPES